MPEKMQIVIEPPSSHPDFLTILDAMEQVLDYFRLASLAEPDEPQNILWKLVSVSMQSPFTVTGEAISLDPTIDIDTIARTRKSRLQDGFKSMLAGNTPHEWTHGEAGNIVEKILKRNKNGIGITRIINDLHEESIPVEITPKLAEAVIEEINKKPLQFLQEDLSHKELGCIDGFLVAAKSDYGSPAVSVRDRLTNREILCRVTEETRDIVSKNMKLDDVWRNKRILVTGLIAFDKSGGVRKIYDAQIEPIATREVSVDDIRDGGFTSGLSPYEYLEKLREGNLG